MSQPFVIRPAAELDLAEARTWYENHRQGLGDEFLTAVETIFARIKEEPEAYPPEYRSVRRAGLRRFPYVVYYRLTADKLEVLGVLHGSRHPRAWRSRA